MNSLFWIDEADAKRFHERLLEVHGGATGWRDEGLLSSALARPHNHATYAEDLDVIHLAALFTAGVVRNHPCVDGNKRTGFLLGILFLELNGYRFTADPVEAAQAVVDLASGNLGEDGYVRFLADNCQKS